MLVTYDIVQTLYYRSARAWLSQTGSSTGGSEYSGPETEQRTRFHPTDQGRSHPAAPEVVVSEE